MSNERQRVSSGSIFEQKYGYCRAVRVGDRVIVAGTAPVWPDGSSDPDPAAQARRCLDIITTALHEVGSGPQDVVRTRMYITDRADVDVIGKVHAEVFGAAQPAATMVVVASLTEPEWKVEIEAEAIIGG